jgi:glycosyltransferase involved in cell wall biosynthesis
VKLIYYKIFAYLFSLVGLCPSLVMVNSTWTKRHIENMWWGSCDAACKTLKSSIRNSLSSKKLSENRNQHQWTVLAYLINVLSIPSALVIDTCKSILYPISKYWFDDRRLITVYPPCNTTSLCEIPITYSSSKTLKEINFNVASKKAAIKNANINSRGNVILSIGQFRPEKDHHLQLR